MAPRLFLLVRRGERGAINIDGLTSVPVLGEILDALITPCCTCKRVHERMVGAVGSSVLLCEPCVLVARDLWKRSHDAPSTKTNGLPTVREAALARSAKKLFGCSDATCATVLEFKQLLGGPDLGSNRRRNDCVFCRKPDHCPPGLRNPAQLVSSCCECVQRASTFLLANAPHDPGIVHAAGGDSRSEIRRRRAGVATKLAAAICRKLVALGGNRIVVEPEKTGYLVVYCNNNEIISQELVRDAGSLLEAFRGGDKCIVVAIGDSSRRFKVSVHGELPHSVEVRLTSGGPADLI
jgi:hypothetical protein